MTNWDDLIAREGAAVWRTAYRLLRDQADADECFQETFLAALEISKRQPVRNWTALLQRLATARAIDRVRQRLRRRRYEEQRDLGQSEANERDPSARAEAEELASELRWAIAQLPVKQSEVFCLHELEDWSYQQIADQLGITANSVGVILHRTRKKLQELLEMKNHMSTILKMPRPAQE